MLNPLALDHACNLRVVVSFIMVTASEPEVGEVRRVFYGTLEVSVRRVFCPWRRASGGSASR